MKTIILSIIFAYLLLGLAVEWWLEGIDSPITWNSVLIVLFWPVTLVSLGICIITTRRKSLKFNKVLGKWVKK